MKMPVINIQNEKVDEVEIDDAICKIKPRNDLVQRLIVWQMAKKRAGTHKAKSRSEITGSQRKKIRQKGTGGARHGSTKAPIFRGGGKAFAPHNRTHDIKMPKKMRKIALKHALSAKINAQEVLVIDQIKLNKPKTCEIAKPLLKMKINNALFIAAEKIDHNFQLAIKNIPNINVIKTQGLNAYDILRHKKILIDKSAIAQISERLL